ncbi:MAG TPA: ABC transporter substrate-binding protein [Longimicrobiales bacterium]
MSRTAERPSGREAGHGAIRLLAVMALCVGAVTCGDRGARGPDLEAETPVYGGTLVIAAASDLDMANGLVSGEARTQEVLRGVLFMTLIRFDPSLEGYEPYLAESWEMLGDTGVVFRIRDDVYWHDGVRTTAYDVAFTYDRARDPATAFPNTSFFREWGAAEVVDSFTIRFRFEPQEEPLAGWPSFPIMPRHLLDSVPPERLRQTPFNRNPVGNGPFRFVSQRPNDRWVFEANPDFPEALGGRPYLDRLIWRVIPENQAQIAEIRAGTVDLIMGARAGQLADLDARPELRAVVRPSRKYQFIGWNARRSPLDDPRVRRALSLGIDREEMLHGLRAGYGELAVGPIDPSHWAFDDSLEPLPYDTAAARVLLAEAGFVDRDGDRILEDRSGADLTLALTTPNTEYNRNVAEKVQSDLARIGVDLEIRLLDFATVIDAVFTERRDFDGVILAFESGIRASELRDLFHSARIGGMFQLAGYSNAEVDRIIDEASRLMDREAATPLWHRLQAIIREEQPWTFLYYTPDLYVVNERVRGVTMDVRGTLETVARWWKVPAASAPVAAAGGGDG